MISNLNLNLQYQTFPSSKEILNKFIKLTLLITHIFNVEMDTKKKAKRAMRKHDRNKRLFFVQMFVINKSNVHGIYLKNNWSYIIFLKFDVKKSNQFKYCISETQSII